MRTKKPALAVDETIALEINGSRQRVRLCATRTGLPPLVIVQHGPGVPVLHEVSKFQRRLHLERDYLVVYWEQRGCGNASAGDQLRALGVRPRDVRRVVLTHLHIDHDGGLAHFPDSDILVSRHELRTAHGWMGRLRGYLPNRWPAWFNPIALDLAAESFGPFPASKRLTTAGDVIAVATPGHTADHISVIVFDAGITYIIAGDASYTEALMLAGQIDGVSADDGMALATLDAIKRYAAERPTVYLPTHDPESAERLSNRRLADASHHQPTTSRWRK